MTELTTKLVQAIDELAEVREILEVVEHYTTADWDNAGMRGCGRLLMDTRLQIERVIEDLHETKAMLSCVPLSRGEYDALLDEIDRAITHYVHERHDRAFEALAALVVRAQRRPHEMRGPEPAEVAHE